MSEEYVNSEQGITILGDKSAFFYHAEQGDIAIEPGGTRRHRRYKVADILQVKEQRKQKRQARQPKEPTFTLDWLYPRDLPACLELDYLVFDRRMIASLDVYEQWIEKNNQIAMCAYDRKDRRTMLAYIAMLPLPETTILEVLQGKRDEMDLRAEDIEDYSRTGEYTLLANSVVTRPDRPDLLYQIIGRIMQCWLDRYPDRYISRIYAQAASAKGDILIQKFYFAPLYVLSSGQAQIVKDAYVLDLTRPGATKVIRSFQQALAEKRETQGLPEVEPSPLPHLPAPSVSPGHLPGQKPEPPVTPVVAPAAHRPPQPRKTVSRSSESQIEALKSDMPAGLIGFREAAHRHGVPENTVNKALKSGRLAATAGSWTVGRASVRMAFNREQLAAFVQLYSRNTRFQRCDDPGCPCQDVQSGLAQQQKLLPSE